MRRYRLLTVCLTIALGIAPRVGAQENAVNEAILKLARELDLQREQIKSLREEVQVLRLAASANGSKIYRSESELSEYAYFPRVAYGPGHKAPVFVVEVPDARVGDWISVHAQCTMNVRSFGVSTFVASQIRIADKRPVLNDVNLIGQPVSPENGENINPQNPYKQLTKFGAIEVKKTPVFVIYYAWASSEAASDRNAIKIVKDYGNMVVQLHRTAPNWSPVVSSPTPTR